MSAEVDVNEVEVALIAEQMKHAHSLLKADVENLRQELAHYRELTNLRLGELESARSDHEARLRGTADGVTQFKVYMGLLNGGTSLMALLAMLKAYLFGG
ncbi:MAG TPA: hypothetical protein VGJ97_11740 [Anaerolineaceae bacterium]|jgi:flagellar motor switch protein FliM